MITIEKKIFKNSRIIFYQKEQGQNNKVYLIRNSTPAYRNKVRP